MVDRLNMIELFFTTSIVSEVHTANNFRSTCLYPFSGRGPLVGCRLSPLAFHGLSHILKWFVSG